MSYTTEQLKSILRAWLQDSVVNARLGEDLIKTWDPEEDGEGDPNQATSADPSNRIRVTGDTFHLGYLVTYSVPRATVLDWFEDLSEEKRQEILRRA